MPEGTFEPTPAVTGTQDITVEPTPPSTAEGLKQAIGLGTAIAAGAAVLLGAGIGLVSRRRREAEWT